MPLRRIVAASLLAAGLLTALDVRADTITVVHGDKGIQGTVVMAPLSEAYRRLDVELESRGLPGQRVLGSFEAGLYDGVAARIFALGDRIPGIHRVHPPVAQLSGNVWVRAGSGISVSRPEDLANYVVAMPAALYTRGLAKHASETIELRETLQMFQMLEAERVDVVILDQTRARVDMADHGLDGFAMLDQPLSEFRLYHYLGPEHGDLASRVTEVLTSMHESGDWIELYERSLQDFLIERQGSPKSH